MSLPDVHSIMQTVIQGFGEGNQLGYDLSRQTFVAVKRENAKNGPTITYDMPQVTAKLNDLILTRDIEPADLQAFVSAVRSRKTSVANSANDPISSIVELAEKKLQSASTPQSSSWQAKIVKEPIEAFLVGDQLKQGDYRIRKGDNEYEIFYFDPYFNKIDTHTTAGVDQKAIREGVDYISRLQKSYRVLKAVEETLVPLDVKIMPSEDFSHFIVSSTSSNASEKASEVRSKGLEDLFETVAKVQQK